MERVKLKEEVETTPEKEAMFKKRVSDEFNFRTKLFPKSLDLSWRWPWKKKSSMTIRCSPFYDLSSKIL
jgi:hypothetical protein